MSRLNARGTTLRSGSDKIDELSLNELQRSLRKPRALLSAALSLLTACMAFAALTPLFAVLWRVIYEGGQQLSLASFTELPPGAMQAGGGFGNAIVGTLVMVGLASLISVPVGILAAVFLAEIRPESKLAKVIRFCAKLLTGLPSIIAGVVAYGAIVMTTGGFSAVAGGAALSVLMLPIVILTAEEAIRMVPHKMKEAAIGMGATKTQMVWKVIFPTAFPSMLTGVMLAVARAAGETAPLLFTALSSDYWIWSGGGFDLMQPTASQAVLIYNFSGQPFDNLIEMAWACSLVLVLIVLGINIAGQALSRRSDEL